MDKQEDSINSKARLNSRQFSEMDAKVAQARLAISELQQEAILNNIPDMIWLKDHQSRFIVVNESFAKSCGFKPEELMGKVDLDICAKEIAQIRREDDLEVMASKKRKIVEEKSVDKSGKIKWIETIKTPIFSEDGKVIGTTGVARDITERKKVEERAGEIRAELEIRVKVRTAELTSLNEELRKEVKERKKIEEKVRESEVKFKTIFDESRDGLVIANLQTRKILMFNKSFCQLLKITPQELEALFIDDLHPKQSLPQVIKDFENQIKSAHGLIENVPVLRKDGSIFYVDITSSRINISGQEYLMGTFRDITERKQAEEEIKIYHEQLEFLVTQRTKALEQEIESRKAAELHSKVLRRQVEMILGATKTGLDIIDENYYLRYVDPIWAQKYGDYTGKRCFEYFMDRKTACPNCALEKAFKTKNIVISEEVLLKEGNRPIQVTSMPYQDEGGEWLCAEINIDISARRKADEELQHYREHLEELVKDRTNELSSEILLHRKAELEKNKLNQELIKSYEKLKSVSLVDSQTGLYNYRYLRNIIEAEYHQARRYAQNLSIVMLDVDYFKSINDVYGVNFGDLVLKQLARQLKCMVRKYDILIRYSGEEFVIVSPRLNRDLALSMAQRLLAALSVINFGNKKHIVKLKLSLAAVSFPDDRIKDGMDLINLAMTVLNRAKDHGGNRAYSSLDLKAQLKKGMERIVKVVGVKSLKNTIDRLTKQSKQGLTESIFAFAKTIELKDHYTGAHVESTVHYATEIAKGLNLPREESELIKQAAILHDLGKIGISENILLKKGKLNHKEYEEIKKHPQIGADIIRPIKFLHGLIPFIFYHHERWDGKGYPSGIKGEDIPVGARVIAIADVYQALISDRPYHKAFSKKTALEIIKKASGKQFDPRIVNIFFKVISNEK